MFGLKLNVLSIPKRQNSLQTPRGIPHVSFLALQVFGSWEAYCMLPPEINELCLKGVELLLAVACKLLVSLAK